MQQKVNTRHRLLSTLASLKFGIILLIVIALASIGGTLIPQGESNIYYQMIYGDILGNFIFHTGLTHVFKSYWFIMVSLLLLVNLIACTYGRYLKLNTFGHWSQYGSPILHLGLVVIIIGSLVSGFFGHSNYFEVPTKTTLSLTEKGYPFDIRVEAFSIDYYDEQSPKQYRTTLTLLESNKPISTEGIKVNQPLQHRGVKIYQSSYGWLMEGIITKDGKSSTFSVPAGESLAVNNNYILQAVPASTDVKGNLLYRFGREDQAAFTGSAKQGEKIATPFGTVEFSDIKPYTGLEIRQDPGVPVVWTGFLLLTAGVMIRFYVRKA